MIMQHHQKATRKNQGKIATIVSIAVLGIDLNISQNEAGHACNKSMVKRELVLT
jgi:hypothetical protein